VRRYVKSSALQRHCAVTLTPFASDEDARSYLPNSMKALIHNPYSRNRVTWRGVVDVSELSTLTPSISYEIAYDGPDGLGRQRYVAAVVGNMWFLADFAALRGGMWSWGEAADVVARQATKIRQGGSALQLKALPGSS
jgi:hypothetical protein